MDKINIVIVFIIDIVVDHQLTFEDHILNFKYCLKF